MNCPNCGELIPDTLIHCWYCSYRVYPSQVPATRAGSLFAVARQKRYWGILAALIGGIYILSLFLTSSDSGNGAQPLVPQPQACAWRSYCGTTGIARACTVQQSRPPPCVRDLQGRQPGRRADKHPQRHRFGVRSGQPRLHSYQCPCGGKFQPGNGGFDQRRPVSGRSPGPGPPDRSGLFAGGKCSVPARPGYWRL